MFSSLSIMTADQCFSPILPNHIHRGALVRAGISTNSGSAHRNWASSKSMPCLVLFCALFTRAASTSERTEDRARRGGFG